MDTINRVAIITELTNRAVNLGKTAIMKSLYLLQTVYGVPLEYDFGIYTYGPYSQTVMSDIEFAEFLGNIDMAPVFYANGISGYRINATETGRKFVSAHHQVLELYNDEISNVVKSFSQKSAKELELYSTVVFVSSSFENNGWDETPDEICTTVQRIKPHFSIEKIHSVYDDLVSHGFIRSGT